MRKITVFNNVSVDGFFAGPHGEIDWFKVIRADAEYDAFTRRNSQSGGVLMFGHTTYDMMRAFWPTAEALKSSPDMAEIMDSSPKIVFSRALQSVEEEPRWKNITLFHEIRPEEIIKLKEQAGNDLTILGSGTIVQQLADLGFIDEYALVVVPVLLGSGKPLFKDVKSRNLKLLEAKSFKNGIVWLRYQPAM